MAGLLGVLSEVYPEFKGAGRTVVSCTGCNHTMISSSPTAQVDEEGSIWCSNCAPPAASIEPQEPLAGRDGCTCNPIRMNWLGHGHEKKCPDYRR